jgi:DsbC/DsbD-like thiol-disulfide interchange protein
MRGVALAAAIATAWSALPAAQAQRPRATVTPVAAEVTAAPGSTVALALLVTLPDGVHVQANQPKDPLLIPTVLSVEAPAGMTVEHTTYPPPDELVQAGRPDPLLVLGPAFEIGVRLSVAADAGSGVHSVPVVLRYQACNDTVCFPPARATAAWALTVKQ